MVVLHNENGNNYLTINYFHFLVILLFLPSLLSDIVFYSIHFSGSLISFIDIFFLVFSCMIEDTSLSFFMKKQHNYIIAI